jgi:hypothetical protein
MPLPVFGSRDTVYGTARQSGTAVQCRIATTQLLAVGPTMKQPAVVVGVLGAFEGRSAIPFSRLHGKQVQSCFPNQPREFQFRRLDFFEIVPANGNTISCNFMDRLNHIWQDNSMQFRSRTGS